MINEDLANKLRGGHKEVHLSVGLDMSPASALVVAVGREVPEIAFDSHMAAESYSFKIHNPLGADKIEKFIALLRASSVRTRASYCSA